MRQRVRSPDIRKQTHSVINSYNVVYNDTALGIYEDTVVKIFPCQVPCYHAAFSKSLFVVQMNSVPCTVNYISRGGRILGGIERCAFHSVNLISKAFASSYSVVYQNYIFCFVNFNGAWPVHIRVVPSVLVCVDGYRVYSQVT